MDLDSVVDVDSETGGVRILRYIVVNDSGRAINPMIVEGQVVGGAAHGIGNALFEWMGYDAGAQPSQFNRQIRIPPDVLCFGFRR